MPPPKRGHFVLHSNVLPPVTAGKYELRSDQTGTPFDVQEERTHVSVSSPRYTMPPDQILSTFPPANGEGAFGDRLPQIVLKRRTLPWERNPAEAAAVSPTPWLALVVVAEGEAELSTSAPVEQCVTAGVSLLDPEDRDVPETVYLAVTQTVLNKIFPTQEDLPLLVHVREVDVQDTELAAGDDDGWAAVVLANRLPVFDAGANKPVRYMVCLVNIEGQLASLPPPVPPVNFFEYELAQDWTVLASTQASQHADKFVTGIGSSFELAQGQLDAQSLAAPPVEGRSARLPAIGPDLDGTATARSTANSAWAKGPTEAVAAAAFATDAARVVRDTMAIGWRFPIERFAVEKVFRFPVLAYWSFTTNEGATFETLMQDLDVGLVGSVPPAVPPEPEGPTVIESGHIELEHQTRRGDTTNAWYRGALVPHPTARDKPDSDGRLIVAHAADQLRRVVPDGREDLSFAAAYEIGRLLALSQLSIVSALHALPGRAVRRRPRQVSDRDDHPWRPPPGTRRPLRPESHRRVRAPRQGGDQARLGRRAASPGCRPGTAARVRGQPRQRCRFGSRARSERDPEGCRHRRHGRGAGSHRCPARRVRRRPDPQRTPARGDGLRASHRGRAPGQACRTGAQCSANGSPRPASDAGRAASQRSRRPDRPHSRRRGDRLMAFKIDAALTYEATTAAVSQVLETLIEHDPDDGDHVVPGELRRFLARLRLLHGVPFSYLVPDADLLPTESIRFFYVDRGWTDALVQGALSVGTITTADRAQLEAIYPYIRNDVDEAERVIRSPHGEERLSGAGGAITGFLLRSRVVSGWPELHVRAYRRDVIADDALTTEAESHPDRMKLLRVERLAPAVLLVLIDGVPEVVHIEEPRRGIQFGARLDPDDPPVQRRAKVRLRDATTGDSVPPKTDFTADNSVPVPFRPGAPGVIDLHQLRERIIQKPKAKVGPTLEPHEFALQMLRFPYRQVFGDPKDTEGIQFFDLDKFTVTTNFVTYKARTGRARGKATAGGGGVAVSDFDFDPGQLSSIIQSKRFLVLDRAAVGIDEIATWDDKLLRDMRLLVPIDVQALFVEPGSAEPMVRLPMLLAGAGVDNPAAGMPPLFDPGTPRPAGVHLHWAMPDALLRGRLEERPAGSPNRLGLRALPGSLGRPPYRAPERGEAAVPQRVGDRGRPRRCRAARTMERRRSGVETGETRRRRGRPRRAHGRARRLGHMGRRVRRRAQPLRVSRPARRHRSRGARWRRQQRGDLRRRRLVVEPRLRSTRRRSQREELRGAARWSSLAAAHRLGRRETGAAG